MPTDAKLAFQGSYEWGPNGGALVALPEAKGLPVPSTSVDYVDVTNLDSTGGFREFIPGLKDAGEITITANNTPALQLQARTYEASGELVDFQVTLPAGTGQASGDVLTFSGYVAVGMDADDIAGAVMINLDIKVSGPVTHVAGAAA